MGLKVALGLIVAATAAAAVSVPTAWADETGLAEVHPWRREGGRICMSNHYHFGSSGAHPWRRTAQYVAVRAWQNFTAFEYGTTWGRYHRAASRKMTCTRSSAGWSCDVQARPCR